MKQIYKILVGMAVGLIGFQAHALTLTGSGVLACAIGPACYYGPSGPPADNPTTADIEAAILAQGGPAVSLFDLYDVNLGDGFDTGSYAGSYETSFINPPGDPDPGPENALITHAAGESSISCPDCFILVEDGASEPNWFVFDISGWNGTENIVMRNFWPGPGSITHVAILGSAVGVPEPGILALVAVGLMGLGLSRHRKIS
jgi:hypothetical protein